MNKIRNILVLLLFPLFLSAQQNDEVRINGQYHNLTFIEFVSEVESNYNIKFYFKKEWVDSQSVNFDANSLTIDQLMERALFSTKLDFLYYPPNTVIILPERRIVKNIPDFSNNVLLSSTEEETTEEPVEDKRYLVGRRPDVTGTIIVGDRNKSRGTKSVTVSGQINELNGGEPLVGATMYIPDLQRGAATNASGQLTIKLSPGTYMAVFQSVGMKEMKANIKVLSAGSFNISLEEQVQAIDEVVVRGQETEKRGTRLGMESVSVETIKELPSLMGEKDVLKVAQLLPGIVSVGEGSAGVNVRGGNADQNLFYINKIPIYNSSHLFGFFSSINSGIVERFSVYKGQVPAEYGGRLSSIFNVETRMGHKEKIYSQGGISPISANAELEVPLVKEKVSMMISGRSSYSDWMLERLNDPDLRNSNASFYDLAGALDFNFSEKTSFNIFGYNSSDIFSLNDLTDYNYANLGVSAVLTHHFSDRLKGELSLVGSNYNFETTEKRIPTEAYSHKYSLDHYEIRGALGWILSEQQTIKIGFSGIKYGLARGEVKPYGESIKTGVNLGEEQGIEAAFFVDDNISIGPRLDVYLGMRYSSFFELGHKMVREYLPNQAIIDENVQEIIEYSDGEQITSHANPEFRVGIDYKLSRESSVKLSATQMTQYLFMLSNTISIAPNDQWKLVDSHIKPPKSIQYAAGYFYNNPKSGISASAEVYYKNATNVAEYKDGADFLSTPYVETTILQGKQEAYGAEFMVGKDMGKLNGWASYTYSRSLMTVDGENDWEDINFGKSYPSNFDKPHVANLVVNYKISRRFSMSSNVVYNTGRPITMPKSVYYVDRTPFVEYSERNARRIPDYIRMDLSLKLEGNLKSKKPMHSYWMFSVYNLLGRKNANSVFFTSEDGGLRGYQYSIIGVPIVTISWNWKLGNYANK